MIALHVALIASIAIGSGVLCRRLLNTRPYARDGDRTDRLATPLICGFTGLGAALAGAASWRLSGPVDADLTALAIAALALAAAIDLDVRRVPDVVTVPAIGLCLVAAMHISGTNADRLRVVWAALTALTVVGGLGLLARRMTRSSFPGGDVLVSIGAALILGAHGWGAVVVGGLASFLSAGLVSHRKHDDSPVLIAFTPHIITGTILSLWIWRLVT